MISRTRLFAGTALAALLASAQSARADLIQWTLSGDFDDGGTFSGTFTYDNVADTVTTWSFATSTGSASVGPNAYSGPAVANDFDTNSSTDIDFDTFVAPALGPYGVYAFLDFNDLPYATAGTVASLTGNEYTADCFLVCGPSIASRAITSGTVSSTDTAVPEPASGALMLAGIGLLGVYRRRRRHV